MEIDESFRVFLNDSLDKVEQTSTVDEFHERFEVIGSLVSFAQPWLPESYFASRFIYGLQEEYQKFIIRFNPVTVLAAYRLASLYEESIYLEYFPEDEMPMDESSEGINVEKIFVEEIVDLYVDKTIENSVEKTGIGKVGMVVEDPAVSCDKELVIVEYFQTNFDETAVSRGRYNMFRSVDNQRYGHVKEITEDDESSFSWNPGPICLCKSTLNNDYVDERIVNECVNPTSTYVVETVDEGCVVELHTSDNPSSPCHDTFPNLSDGTFSFHGLNEKGNSTVQVFPIVYSMDIMPFHAFISVMNSMRHTRSKSQLRLCDDNFSYIIIFGKNYCSFFLETEECHVQLFENSKRDESVGTSTLRLLHFPWEPGLVLSGWQYWVLPGRFEIMALYGSTVIDFWWYTEVYGNLTVNTRNISSSIIHISNRVTMNNYMYPGRSGLVITIKVLGSLVTLEHDSGIDKLQLHRANIVCQDNRQCYTPIFIMPSFPNVESWLFDLGISFSWLVTSQFRVPDGVLMKQAEGTSTLLLFAGFPHLMITWDSGPLWQFNVFYFTILSDNFLIMQSCDPITSYGDSNVSGVNHRVWDSAARGFYSSLVYAFKGVWGSALFRGYVHSVDNVDFICILDRNPQMIGYTQCLCVIYNISPACLQVLDVIRFTMCFDPAISFHNALCIFTLASLQVKDIFHFSEEARTVSDLVAYVGLLISQLDFTYKVAARATVFILEEVVCGFYFSQFFISGMSARWVKFKKFKQIDHHKLEYSFDAFYKLKIYPGQVPFLFVQWMPNTGSYFIVKLEIADSDLRRLASRNSWSSISTLRTRDQSHDVRDYYIKTTWTELVIYIPLLIWCPTFGDSRYDMRQYDQHASTWTGLIHNKVLSVAVDHKNYLGIGTTTIFHALLFTTALSKVWILSTYTIPVFIIQQSGSWNFHMWFNKISSALFASQCSVTFYPMTLPWNALFPNKACMHRVAELKTVLEKSSSLHKGPRFPLTSSSTSVAVQLIRVKNMERVTGLNLLYEWHTFFSIELLAQRLAASKAVHDSSSFLQKRFNNLMVAWITCRHISHCPNSHSPYQAGNTVPNRTGNGTRPQHDFVYGDSCFSVDATGFGSHDSWGCFKIYQLRLAYVRPLQRLGVSISGALSCQIKSGMANQSFAHGGSVTSCLFSLAFMILNVQSKANCLKGVLYKTPYPSDYSGSPQMVLLSMIIQNLIRLGISFSFIQFIEGIFSGVEEWSNFYANAEHLVRLLCTRASSFGYAGTDMVFYSLWVLLVIPILWRIAWILMNYTRPFWGFVLLILEDKDPFKEHGLS